MPTLTSGDTLSLNNLAGATGFTQNSNVSLGNIRGSAVTTGLSFYAVDSIDDVSGFTYAVENTSETYTLGTTGGGSRFSQISGRGSNVTWGITGGDKLSVSTCFLITFLRPYVSCHCCLLHPASVFFLPLSYLILSSV